MKEILIGFYLEYVNDFLTVERFAEHHEISPEQALIVINLGRELHEANVAFLKSQKVTKPAGQHPVIRGLSRLLNVSYDELVQSAETPTGKV